MQTKTTALEPAKENAGLPASPASKLYTFVPQNLTEAMTFAKMLADSDLVPVAYKGKPGNCLIAMQYGAELGIPPLQALQCIAVINGKPGIYGDMGRALLLSKGFGIEERDVPEIMAKGQAWCRVTRPAQLNPTKVPPTERTYSLKDANTAGLWGKQGPWTTNPFRQMAWRAFWFAARDGAGDILKGLMGVEELRDYDMDTTLDEPARPPMPEPTPDAPTDAEPEPQASPSQPDMDEANDSVEDPPAVNLKMSAIAVRLVGARRMAAKFDAPCKHCGAPIKSGTEILYIGDGHDKGRYCAAHAV